VALNNLELVLSGQMCTLRILKTIPVDATEGHLINNKEMMDQFKDPNTEIVYRGLRGCKVKAVCDEQTREAVSSLHLRMVLEAEKEGFDAIAMGCLLEPGVREAKQRSGIPVVGALEASLHLASMLGKNISFVLSGSDKILGEDISRTGNDNILLRLIDGYNFKSRLASIRGIGLEVLDFFPEYKNLEKLKCLMLAECRQAVENDKADVIVMYGGITVLRYLQKALRVPVINQKQAQIMMAEVLAKSKLADESSRAIRRSLSCTS
jgi:Asp/Glu/hydantoin racemase